MEKIIYIIITLVLFSLTISIGFNAVTHLAQLSIIPAIMNGLVAVLCWIGCKKCFKKI